MKFFRNIVFFAIAVLLAGTVPAGARAEESLVAATVVGERQLSLKIQQQQRLQKQLEEEGKRIARLKAQPRSVARDYQLQRALQQTAELADKLTALSVYVRQQRQQLLTMLKQQLVTTPAARVGVVQNRIATLQRELAATARIGKLAVDNGVPSAWDSPEDIEEKADLFSDSELKLRRQLRQIRQQIVQLERRGKLQRYARSADDGLFVEDAPRRTAMVAVLSSRTTTTGSTRHPESVADVRGSVDKGLSPGAVGNSSAPPSADPSEAVPNSSSEPTPAANDSSSYSDPPTVPKEGGGAPVTNGSSKGNNPTTSGVGFGLSGGGTSSVLSLRDAMDPNLLVTLQSKTARGDTKSQLALLKSAASQLDKLAAELATKANKLRDQAAKVRTQK